MTEITTVRAFGRDFDTSENGFLLDADGKETKFKTMELEIYHAALPNQHRLSKSARPGDYIAVHGATTIPTASDDIQTFRSVLLVRDGRMVESTELLLEGMLYD